MDIIQKTGKIRRRNQLPAGRIRYKKNKTQERSDCQYPDDFLSQQFRPVLNILNPSKKIINKHVASFYKSIENLSALYKFKPLLKTNKRYPFCIAEVFENAQKELLKQSQDLELVIIEDDNQNPVIATVKEIDIGMKLYYVPLNALMKLHQLRKNETFALLLSIYAYLHHHAGMPLLDQSNYVMNTYDNMKQSFEDSRDEFDKQEYQNTIRSFTIIDRVAPILNRQIANTGNLYDFLSRMEKFIPADSFDQSLHSLAHKFRELWHAFPDGSFTSNNAGEFLHSEEEDRAYLDQFFSFCWSFDDWMMDQLLEWVNCDLQERTVFDVPFSIQLFDTEQTKNIHDFTYPKQLLELLNELSEILNELYA